MPTLGVLGPLSLADLISYLDFSVVIGTLNMIFSVTYYLDLHNAICFLSLM